MYSLVEQGGTVDLKIEFLFFIQLKTNQKCLKKPI